MDKETVDAAVETANGVIPEETLASLDTFMAKVVEASTIVTQKLIEVSPEVADALLNIVQFKGIFELVIGFVITLVPLFLTLFLIRKISDSNNEDIEDKPFLLTLTGIAGGLITTFSLFSTGILTFELWLQAIFPEGYIGLRALAELGLKI